MSVKTGRMAEPVLSEGTAKNLILGSRGPEFCFEHGVGGGCRTPGRGSLRGLLAGPGALVWLRPGPVQRQSLRARRTKVAPRYFIHLTTLPFPGLLPRANPSLALETQQ